MSEQGAQVYPVRGAAHLWVTTLQAAISFGQNPCPSGVRATCVCVCVCYVCVCVCVCVCFGVWWVRAKQYSKLSCQFNFENHDLACNLFFYIHQATGLHLPVNRMIRWQISGSFRLMWVSGVRGPCNKFALSGTADNKFHDLVEWASYLSRSHGCSAMFLCTFCRRPPLVSNPIVCRSKCSEVMTDKCSCLRK